MLIKIIVLTVRVFLSALELFMFVRAIMSWIMPGDDNKITQFLYVVTEPFIYPVRRLMDKMNIGRGLPVDLSFFVTFVIITVLRAFF